MVRSSAAPSRHRPVGRAMTGAFYLCSGLVTLVLVTEVGLHLAYAVRNALVTAVPIPYVVGSDYGPVPPWIDGLRILEPDPTLIWKGRPGLSRTYVDVFAPTKHESDRIALLRQFGPELPAAFRDKPVWQIALNADGFRDAELPSSKPPQVPCVSSASATRGPSAPTSVRTLVSPTAGRAPRRPLSRTDRGGLQPRGAWIQLVSGREYSEGPRAGPRAGSGRNRARNERRLGRRLSRQGCRRTDGCDDRWLQSRRPVADLSVGPLPSSDPELGTRDARGRTRGTGDERHGPAQRVVRLLHDGPVDTRRTI